MKIIYGLVISSILCFASNGYCSVGNSTGHFKKVVWIVFENMNYSKVIKQKDFAQVAANGASFSNMIAAVHPSQGNYISMIAGSILGVTSDSPVNLSASHLGDLLEKKGLSWGVYAEDYPGNCFTGKSSENYVRKHVPFMSFTNVTSNPERCARIVDDSHFDQDYSSQSLPTYSMYVPDLKNDGHDTDVEFAGQWLTMRFGHLLSNPTALKDILFVITFDESSFLSSVNQIYTVVVGANVKAGSVNSTKLSHPALLKMIEDEWGLDNLGREDLTAPVIAGIWK